MISCTDRKGRKEREREESQCNKSNLLLRIKPLERSTDDRNRLPNAHALVFICLYVYIRVWHESLNVKKAILIRFCSTQDQLFLTCNRYRTVPKSVPSSLVCFSFSTLLFTSIMSKMFVIIGLIALAHSGFSAAQYRFVSLSLFLSLFLSFFLSLS
jgi:hypothetical protein